MELRKGLIWSSKSFSSTPAFRAAVYMSSSKGSQPVKTRSPSPASGRNSFTLGERNPRLLNSGFGRLLSRGLFGSYLYENVSGWENLVFSRINKFFETGGG